MESIRLYHGSYTIVEVPQIQAALETLTFESSYSLRKEHDK